MPARAFEAMEATLKKAVAALKEANVDFLLGGSIAAWARGGPPLGLDLDLMVRPGDAERALQALVDAGMRPERPPEDWLVKAWDGDVLVDLIYSPTALPVDDELLSRGEELDVGGFLMPVMALEDVLATQLLSMDEHKLDYATPLQIARSVREQIDWEALRGRTAGSPFAKAFFVIVEELGIAPPAGEAGQSRPPATRPEPARSG